MESPAQRGKLFLIMKPVNPKESISRVKSNEILFTLRSLESNQSDNGYPQTSPSDKYLSASWSTAPFRPGPKPPLHTCSLSPSLRVLTARCGLTDMAAAIKSKAEEFGVVSRGAPPPRLSTSSEEEDGNGRARKKVRWDAEIGGVPEDSFISPKGWSPSSWRALPVSGALPLFYIS